jgi:hypothetical protein
LAQLEGKEELGVEKGLFKAGLSASCNVVGKADMAGACVSNGEMCNRVAGEGERLKTESVQVVHQTWMQA